MGDQRADREIVRRIGLAWRELRRGTAAVSLRSHLVGPDGTPMEQAQLDALEILAGEPDGQRMSDFADAMRVDPSTATRAVDRLQRVGLAERVMAGDDRRVVVARLTSLGRSTFERIRRQRAAGIELLLEPFTAAEREQLADLLERFVVSIDRVAADLASTAAGGQRRP